MSATWLLNSSNLFVLDVFNRLTPPQMVRFVWLKFIDLNVNG